MQMLMLQTSLVQAFPSSQSVFTVQQPGIFVWVHPPVTELHESVVHTLPSSQSSGVPGVQTPLKHVSLPLHKSPSGHRCPSSLLS